MEKAPHNTGEDTPPESQELNQFEKMAQKVGEFGSATKERSKTILRELYAHFMNPTIFHKIKMVI